MRRCTTAGSSSKGSAQVTQARPTPSQERAQEKQNVHGRPPRHPGPAGDKRPDGRAVLGHQSDGHADIQLLSSENAEPAALTNSRDTQDRQTHRDRKQTGADQGLGATGETAEIRGRGQLRRTECPFQKTSLR